ncbi:MAG: Hpt domain-containing protein [Fimbriimonadales bacterium]|nr:Hpt domain-containing protein [Fimbriimonadales bacterium]
MLNWDYLHEITGGDSEFIAELLSDFLNIAPELLAQIEQAVAQGDAAALTHAAHTLKGSARSIGAESLAEKALALEQIGKSGMLQDAPEALPLLQAQWAQLQSYLQNWLQQQAA